VLAGKGVPCGGAATAEADQYNCNAELMRLVGCNVEAAQVEFWNGVPASLGPRIVLHPNFALFPGDFKKRFTQPHLVHIKANSTLIVLGEGVTVECLWLDGALRITSAGSGSEAGKLLVKCPPLTSWGGGKWVSNKGHSVHRLGMLCGSDDPVINMRGYYIRTEEEATSVVGKLQRVVFNGVDSLTEGSYYRKVAEESMTGSGDDCSICSIM
jgi:hypothetical protein